MSVRSVIKDSLCVDLLDILRLSHQVPESLANSILRTLSRDDIHSHSIAEIVRYTDI